MTLMKWEQRFSVGIKTADEQHKNLIELINTLSIVMQDGESNDVVAMHLMNLIDSTDKHFKYEEQLFQLYDYPEAVEHKQQHDELLGQLRELYRRVVAGTSMLSIEIMAFLKGWLIEHIVVDDQQYSEYLILRGVK